MAGTPDNTVILHWDEYQTAWAKLSWGDWVRFRGSGEGGPSLLAGADAGEHYFLVCVLGDRGELANVIRTDTSWSTDGLLVHGFDGPVQAEREEYHRIQTLLSPTIEDSDRYQELDARDLRSTCRRRTVGPLLGPCRAGGCAAQRRLLEFFCHRNLPFERDLVKCRDVRRGLPGDR